MAAFTAKGYQGFGSFHSDNVEELIRVPDAEYQPPPRPSDLPPLAFGASPASSSAAFASPSAPPPPGWGRHLLSPSGFLLDPEWLFVNHGAFGSPCGAARLECRAWGEHAELQPLRFIDRELLPQMVCATRRLAALVRAPPTSVALVPNATYGLNSVIASVGASRRDTPLCRAFVLDIGYGSVKTMAAHAFGGADRVTVGKVAFPLPCAGDGEEGKEGEEGRRRSYDDEGAGAGAAALPPLGPASASLVSQVVALLPARESLGLVILDHVTSNTGLVMPIRALVRAVKEARPEALVLVDGAHGLGAFDLDLPSLGADFYVSNAHKWLCSTRGLGMLYAAPQHAASGIVRGACISHGSGAGFNSEFVWDGARDYSAACALPALLDWWEWAGGLNSARAYCRGLLESAVALLRREWGGVRTQAGGMELYSHMACVQLPPACLPPGAAFVRGRGFRQRANEEEAEGPGDDAAATDPEAWAYRCTSTHGKMLQDAMHFGFKTECPVKTLKGPRQVAVPPTSDASGGAAWEEGETDLRSYVRISCAVYNTIEDFQRLAGVVKRIRWKRREGTLGGEGGGGGGGGAAVELDALPAE